MLYIKLFIEREKNTGQSAPECPFNSVVSSPSVASFKHKLIRCNFNVLVFGFISL